MASKPNDQYLQYFTEKVWEMIPAFYRTEDGLADPPGTLRAIVEILAEESAVLRRSSDRLWDDEFIDLCDNWAVPYIADLVATRLVSALNLRGRRVDVAKTIYYRRRKGTLRVLEELISDIAGWEGKAVEEFRRLARFQHGLDPKPAEFTGQFTGTPPGGLADLRRPRGADLVNSPFDEYFHHPDVRRHHGGLDGRYNIPKIGFHLYRIPASELTGVDPAAGPNPNAFTFDPSGRDIPLFVRRSRPENFDWDQWRSAMEWELPAPMRCRVLGHAEYEITEAVVQDLISKFGLLPGPADDLRKLRGIRLPNEAGLIAAIDALPSKAVLLGAAVFDEILRQALVQDCGKSALLTSYVPPGSDRPKSIRVEEGGVEVPASEINAGKLASWSTLATGKRLIIDPELGRLLFLGAAPGKVKVAYLYGFAASIGAGSYDRSANMVPPTVAVISGGGAIAAAAIDPGTVATAGVTQIGDSSTYGPVADKSGIHNAVIEAKDLERPYLRIASTWTLTGSAKASLIIDGLWIGAGGNFSLILAGDFAQVTIRRSTIDPGGIDAKGNPINPLPLAVAGTVEELTIDHSITGPIATTGAGVVDHITVADSIIDAIPAAAAAIALPASRITIRRSTIFGGVQVDRMDASEALITGKVDVADTQDGCFRFGAALVGSRVPRPYESHFIRDSNHFFTSRRFGQPGFAQLSQSAPAGLLTGAENGSEIGAFSSLNNPIRMAGLQAKVDEFLPFGLIPIYILET